MADVYLNPLDTAPVRRSGTDRAATIPTLPHTHSPQEIRAFSELLSQQSAQQEPTPVLTNKALSIPSQESMKSVASSEIRAQVVDEAPASLSDPNQEEDAVSSLTQPKSMREAFSVVTSNAPGLGQENDVINPLPLGLFSPAASNMREILHRQYEKPTGENLSSANRIDAETAISTDEGISSAMRNESIGGSISHAKPLNEFSSSPSVLNVQATKQDRLTGSDDGDQWPEVHTVRRGDTLSEIVANALRDRGASFSTQELYRMVNQVAEMNGIQNPNLIHPGQQVDISAVNGRMLASGGPVTQLSPFLSPPDVDPIPMSGFQAPLQGSITSGFGPRVHPIRGVEHHHNGIDIAAPEGTPIQPVKPGVVIFSGEMSGYGKMVEIDHGDHTRSLYAHLSKRLVNEGERVELSKPIGLVGQTGSSTGPHLHLEIHDRGRPIDPLSVLPKRSISMW